MSKQSHLHRGTQRLKLHPGHARWLKIQTIWAKFTNRGDRPKISVAEATDRNLTPPNRTHDPDEMNMHLNFLIFSFITQASANRFRIENLDIFK
jgi:hypothetical protein